MSDNPFPRDFDPEFFDPRDISVFALSFWSKWRPRLFSNSQLRLLLHGDEGAEILTADFDSPTFESANQRVRTWIELQDLQSAPDFLRHLHRLQRESDEPDSPSLPRRAALAAFNRSVYERWESLAARVAHLDEQLQLAQMRREWIECARDVAGRDALRHLNSLLTCDSENGDAALKRAPTLEARIVLGLRQGFEGPSASFSQVRDALHARLQNEPFTLAIRPLEIVYRAGTEAGVEVALIDDPRFPVGEAVFKTRALLLGKWLLMEFQQHRLSVIFGDECVMVEAGQKNER